MKTLRIDQLKSGMVLSEPVRTKHGQTIAKAGTVLNHKLIARFAFYHIDSVDIEVQKYGELSDQPEPVFEAEPAPEPAPNAPAPADQSPATVAFDANHHSNQSKPKDSKSEKHVHTNIEDMVSFQQKLSRTTEFQDFQVSYTKSLESLKIFFQEIKEKQVIDLSPARFDVAHALLKNRTSLEQIDMIHSMRSIDDSVYAHSLNVALISRLIGKWLKLSKEDLRLLTVAGLLHDIGKTELPEELLTKSGKLTDEEFAMIQKHPLYGARLLKAANADLRIRNAALQHHERFDGSGYPRGLEAEEIDDFAAIIAIADVYDAMTAARPYRAPLCTFQVIEEFEKAGFQKYNTRFILTFLSRMASLYSNSKVTLSDGRTARIIYLNRQKPSRPIVEDNNGNLIDLSLQLDLHITNTL